MKSRAKTYRAGIIIGVLLMLGPLAGLLISMVGMLRAFATLGDNGITDQRDLAHHIGLTLSGTAVGLMLLPVGIAVLVTSLVLRARARREGPPPLPTAYTP